jgi:hypothetical protein
VLFSIRPVSQTDRLVGNLPSAHSRQPQNEPIEL